MPSSVSTYICIRRAGSIRDVPSSTASMKARAYPPSSFAAPLSQARSSASSARLPTGGPPPARRRPTRYPASEGSGGAGGGGGGGGAAGAGGARAVALALGQQGQGPVDGLGERRRHGEPPEGRRGAAGGGPSSTRIRRSTRRRSRSISARRPTSMS